MFERFRKKHDPRSERKLPERRMEAVLEEFLSLPLPDAIDGLTFRVSMASDDGPAAVSDFERYAARVLDEACASEIRGIAIEHPITMIRLDSTGMPWARFDQSAMSPEQAERVLAVEGALCRLEIVRRMMPQDGEEWIRTNPPERICSIFDWDALRSVADRAVSYLEGEAPENPLLSIEGVEGLRGGNWDVMTRFGARCEEAVLPYRLAYSFDADVQAGCMAVAIRVPRASMFPSSRWDDDAQQWVDVAAERPRAAAAYALRLAVLMAAAAFSASVGISRVVVSAFHGFFDDPAALSIEFGRMGFLNQTLPAIAQGKLSAKGTECAFDELMALVAPTQWVMAPEPDGTLGDVQPLDAGLPDRRIPLAEDDRNVPTPLVGRLRADKVRELDVMSEQSPELAEHFRAIMADRQDAPLLAIAQLEELVSTSEAADRQAHADAEPERAPLYCQGTYARYLIALATDDAQQRFFRASDVGYSARTALMQLYLELGDREAALAQAQACVDIAPSSPAAYQELVTALAEADDFARIVVAEKEALRLAAAPDEIAYLYYRLAFAFWQTGERDLGLACYLRVPPSAPVGDMAAKERAELMAEMGREGLDGFDRDAILRAGGVPLAPTAEVMQTLAETAIRFCEAGIPLAAGPSANMLGAIKRNDVLSALSLALREGA